MKIHRAIVFLTVGALFYPALRAEPLTRAEALRIAEAYAGYRWNSTDKNVLQGKDVDGVAVHTPNVAPGDAADPSLWTIGAANTGVPYKWGGFDSLDSFAAGVKAGKAAGDMYNPEKRKLGGSAVSSHSVGIDCSGFISRCWKLSKKYSTDSLPSICTKLSSAADLKPGDIMNSEGGHVIMFAKWLDGKKETAQFYESSPFSKVTTNTYSLTTLVSRGYSPLRYKLMQD